MTEEKLIEIITKPLEYLSRLIMASMLNILYIVQEFKTKRRHINCNH